MHTQSKRTMAVVFLVALLGVASAAQLPEPQAAPITGRPIPGGIPRIFHQNFMGGLSRLQDEAKAGKFRLDWMRSVKAYHPGWQYMFWDLQACEQLLESRYPWFLPLFRSVNHITMRSDVIRIFILHAYGGVYADMDTEVYANIENSLSGHSLIFSSEENGYFNNAQMASVAGHPFWEMMMQQAVHVFSKKYEEIKQPDILNGTGPWAMTRVFKEYLWQHGQIPQYPLKGTYSDIGWQKRLLTRNGTTTDPETYQTTFPSTITLYQRGAWFTPCTWNDMACQVLAVRCANVIRSSLLCQWHAAYWPQTAWKNCIADKDHKASRLRQLCAWRASGKGSGLPAQLTTCMRRFGKLVGQHHFTGSWLSDAGIRHDSAESQSKHKHVTRDVLDFFNQTTAFVEANAFCPRPQERSAPYDPPKDKSLWEGWLDYALKPLTAVKREKQTAQGNATGAGGGAGGGGRCRWLSVFMTQCVQEPATCCVPAGEMPERFQHLLDIAAQAKQAGCQFDILTDLAPSALPSSLQPSANGQQNVRVAQVSLALSPSAQLTAQNGTMGFAGMFRPISGQGRLQLLHVAAPGTCVWKALGLLTQELEDIMEPLRPSVLLLQTGSLRTGHAHLAAATYQQLLQSQDYMGHAHLKLKPASAETAGANQTCPSCEAAEGEVLVPELWLGFVRRTQLLSNLFDSGGALWVTPPW